MSLKSEIAVGRDLDFDQLVPRTRVYPSGYEALSYISSKSEFCPSQVSSLHTEKNELRFLELYLLGGRSTTVIGW